MKFDLSESKKHYEYWKKHGLTVSENSNLQNFKE